MAKKNIPKRHKIHEKKKLGKKRILLIQAFVTLLIAGFLIMSGMDSEPSVTGNVIGGSNSSDGAMKIFILLGVAIGLFSFLEIVILFVVSYF